MSSKNKQSSISSKPREKLLDPSLVKLLSITILAYILLWAIVSSFLGSGFVALVVTPLLAISLFVITKWDRTRTAGDNFSLKQLLIFPRLNYLNILVIVLSIFVVAQIFSLSIFMYLYKTRAEFIDSTPDNLTGFFSAITDDRQSIILFIIATYMSYAVGGFIAGWLPNKKCPAPYRHAVVGAIIFSLLNITLTASMLVWGDGGDSPSQQEAGLIILGYTPAFIFSMLGAWLAIGTREGAITKETSKAINNKSESVTLTADSSTGKQTSTQSVITAYSKRKKQRISKGKNNKQKSEKPPANAKQPPAQATASQLQEESPTVKTRWSRRRFAILSVCIFGISLIGTVIWIATIPSPVNCPNPPATATLNFWPVTYSSHAENCHDYQSIDARLVGDQYNYSKSQQEWERGLTAHTGDEIYALIYINNGAATNAENMNPGRGIARNVKLTTEINPEPSTVHYIKVRFAGDNTNTVVNSYKITTAEQERLEIVSRSGEIRNHTASEIINKNLDIGNNTITIGDLPPKWDDSIFIRFRLKVVN
jgi:hypothetical protein